LPLLCLPLPSPLFTRILAFILARISPQIEGEKYEKTEGQGINTAYGQCGVVEAILARSGLFDKITGAVCILFVLVTVKHDK
jgi:hypothetical protein